MSTNLTNTAKIVNIVENTLILAMERKHACEGCSINKVCGTSNCENDPIKVEVEDVYRYTVGEEVLLTVTVKQGYLALFLGYLLPFLIVLTILIAMSRLHYSDLLIGIVSLLVLGLYYVILWSMHKRVSKKFMLKVQKK